VNVRGLVRNLAVYAVALGIIWFLIRDVSLSQLARDLKLANLWMFVPAADGSFLIWFLGETLLYSKLLSYVQIQGGFMVLRFACIRTARPVYVVLDAGPSGVWVRSLAL
jgi:hypothetical protein